MLSFKKIWDFLSNIGINDRVSPQEQPKIRLLNQIVVMALSADTMALGALTLIEAVTSQEYVLLFFIALVELSSMVFNYFGRYNLARLIFTIFLPVMITVSTIYYGMSLGIHLVYLICLILAIIFFDQAKVRLSFLVMIIGLHLFATKIINRFGTINIYSEGYDPWIDNQNLSNIIFIACTSCITLITSWYLNKIASYQKQTEELLGEISNNNDQLKQVNKEMERFAYIASHDMKTPLRTVVSFLGIIERKLKNKDYEGMEEYLQFAQGGAQQMHHLITDILEYARLDNQEDKMELVDLNTIFTRVQQQLNTLIKAGNAVIEVNTLPTIYCVDSKVLVLFQNLLENGLKYNTKDNPHVVVSHEVKGHFLLLKFEDNGIGIEPEYREHIFEMFKRLHNTQEYSGTGIGLAICRKIVENMGGKIWVEGNEANGSTFCVQWPVTILQGNVEEVASSSFSFS